jgi:flavin reductase ActVB
VIERQTFFEIMASFPSGVAIVTTTTGDGSPQGLTTTAVASVSAHPPTVLVCIDVSARTLPALRAERRFVVNFVREGRSDLCLLFASKTEDKFADVAWEPTGSGLSLLAADAIAWVECETVQELVVGDHVVLIAQVGDGAVAGEDGVAPLMYYRRSWGVWAPAREERRSERMRPIEVGGRDLRWHGAEM